ncbi:zinc finger, CCHC-type, retrotransposon gag domain protein [Tanacetum coccineum]
MISSSEEEPFKDLESDHEVSSHETASPLRPSSTSVVPPPTTVIPPPTHQSPYLRQTARMRAAMDQPARPTMPRPDVPRNYGAVMNCQELERMQQLTSVLQDHMNRLDLHSQTIQDILNRVERIDQRTNKDQDAAFEARALNRRTWYLAFSVVLVVLLLLVSSITKCAEGNKVEYTDCLLQGRALTWWNTQVQTRGREAANGLSWENFKKLLTEEYCRKDQVQNLESKFLNHMMICNKVDKYMTRFNELARMVPHMVFTEEKRVDHYIWGLVPEIRRMVASSNPITLQAVVGLAYRLTNDVVRSSRASKGNDSGRKRHEDQQRNRGRAAR